MASILTVETRWRRVERVFTISTIHEVVLATWTPNPSHETTENEGHEVAIKIDSELCVEPAENQSKFFRLQMWLTLVKSQRKVYDDDTRGSCSFSHWLIWPSSCRISVPPVTFIISLRSLVSLRSISPLLLISWTHLILGINWSKTLNGYSRR